MMRAVIYARVSVKHKNQKDRTIQAQLQACRQLLQRLEPSAAVEEFTDLGYSGKSMERPAFQRLYREIRKGGVDILAVKDFSRIGRSYREVGDFVEKLLPRNHVRLLTVSERFDSEKNHNVMAAGLFHLLNEWYLHDLSCKVSAVKHEKRRAGNYMGSIPPYGYRTKVENGIRVLEKDPGYAVVEKILTLHKKGYSSGKIAEELYKWRINPPKLYRETGQICFDGENGMRWQSGTIRKLLQRER